MNNSYDTERIQTIVIGGGQAGLAVGYHLPFVPEFARDFNPGIFQIRSHGYRNPSQLQEGPVLIVGAGNSGGDIGIEVARSHPTWIAGKESGHIPWSIDSFLARFFLVR